MRGQLGHGHGNSLASGNSSVTDDESSFYCQSLPDLAQLLDVPTKAPQVLMWPLKLPPVTSSSFWCLFAQTLDSHNSEMTCIRFL